MTQFYFITRTDARVAGMVAISNRLTYKPEMKNWAFDEVMRMRKAGRKAEVVSLNSNAGLQVFADLNYKAIDPTGKDRIEPARIWANPTFITGYELEDIRANAAAVERD